MLALFEFENIGKVLLFIGAAIALAGFVLLVLGKTGLGRLPGDLIIKRENLTVYIPITTMILVSILISLLLYLFSKWR